MGSQDFATSPQSTKTASLHSYVALDATAHSQAVIENLHHYISPAKALCNFLYVLPGTDDKDFKSIDMEAQAETERVVNTEFDRYSDILFQHQLSVSQRHFIRGTASIEAGIVDFIHDEPGHLLVLGMHGHSARDNGWRISSTSYHIATHTPSPVLVLKNPAPKNRPLRVLFATDGSEHATDAARMLCRFLPEATSEISVLNVVSVNYYMMPMVEPYIDYAPLEKAMKGEATQLVESTRSLFEANGYSVPTATFALGDPIDQILHEVQKSNIDLVVIGAHGAGGRLTSWLLGGVSSKILEYSPASVAILR